MTQQDRHVDLKVLALAGAFLVLLVADMLVLTLLVMPLAASARRVPTTVSVRATPAELAIIVPTHDPRRPWPTRTPTYTVTPWLVFLSTPEPPPVTPAPPQNTLAPAPLLPAQNTAPLQNTLEPAGPSVEATYTTLVEVPTPVLQPDATAAIAPPTSTIPPTEMALPSDTPVDAPSETPAGSPAETPVGNPGETPPPPAPPATPGDVSDFEAYLREHRNIIAGQPLDIVTVTMDMTDGAVPRFVVEVAGSETTNVFAAQPAADVADYGRHLLDDAKRYLGGQHCGIVVESTYETSDRDACSNTPAWCRLGAYDETTTHWTVTWAYVRGSFTGGLDTIEAWNEGP